MNKVQSTQRRNVRPTHPGEILKEDVLPELGLSQGEFAERLGVSRRTINEVMAGKRPVTPDMAHRLGRFLGNGAAPWLNMQRALDMWDALHMDTRQYESIQPIKMKVA